MIPENGDYAIAAYIATAVIYLSYALTLRVRTRRLAERSRTLSDESGRQN